MKYSKGKARERRTRLAEAEKNVKRYELICDNNPSQNNVNCYYLFGILFVFCN